MQFQSRPWWRWQMHRLAAANMRSTWVVSPAVRIALEREPDAPSNTTIGDPDAPMFASIVAGVEAIGDRALEGVFILPVDTPAPSPATWAALAAVSQVSVPAWEGRRGHPVYLPWPWALIHLRQSHAGVAPPRLDALIGPDARIVSVADRTICANLNTLEDVAAFERSPAAAESTVDRTPR